MTTGLHVAATTGRASGFDRLSIVIPVRDSAARLAEFHERLGHAVAALPLLIEFVYVDDGSRDGSARVLRHLRQRDTRVAVLELSRRFSRDAALMAGLDHARGDAVVVVDADLQDPPELIGEMVKAWRGGVDVVVAYRERQSTDGRFVERSRRLFYRAVNAASDIPVADHPSNFRLMSRRAVEAFLQLPERRRYVKGLFAWTGFPHQTIEYRAEHGESHRPVRAYVERLADSIDELTAFTSAPLRVVSALAAVVALLCLIGGMALAVFTVLHGLSDSGPRLTAAALFFIAGVQLLLASVKGEYLGHLFEESKRRPLYVLKNVQPAADLTGALRIASGAPQ